LHFPGGKGITQSLQRRKGADMAEDQVPEHDMAEHYRTYTAFRASVVAHILGAAFVLMALVTFAFGNTLATVLGWATIVIGGAAILIDLWVGNKNWMFSLIALAGFGLITAAGVS
jgi:hypothetical protein